MGRLERTKTTRAASVGAYVHPLSSSRPGALKYSSDEHGSVGAWVGGRGGWRRSQTVGRGVTALNEAVASRRLCRAPWAVGGVCLCRCVSVCLCVCVCACSCARVDAGTCGPRGLLLRVTAAWRDDGWSASLTRGALFCAPPRCSPPRSLRSVLSLAGACRHSRLSCLGGGRQRGHRRDRVCLAIACVDQP